MLDTTPVLGLPYLLPNQAQKHVTVNESLGALDIVVQLVLQMQDQVAPPLNPEEGENYALSGAPTGAWSGYGGQLASWRDAMWHFTLPQVGWRAWSVADSDLLIFDGSGWQSWLNPVPLLGVNASADTANRLSVKSPASLFDHDGDDHRLKINKATALDTASVLLQSNYSGRAEFGIAGDDYFRIKVSPDGAAWSDALTIDPDNGNVGIQTDTPNYALEVGGLIGVTSAAPGLYLTEADQGIDERTWRITAGGSNFFIQSFNDAGDAAQQALVITRTGLTVDSIRLQTEGAMAIYAGVGQNVAIGHSAPSTRLHVNGPVRVGQYAKAVLPGAASVGAGTIAYVTDASGGAQLAYSDGTDWRKVRDGVVV